MKEQGTVERLFCNGIGVPRTEALKWRFDDLMRDVAIFCDDRTRLFIAVVWNGPPVMGIPRPRILITEEASNTTVAATLLYKDDMTTRTEAKQFVQDVRDGKVSFS